MRINPSGFAIAKSVEKIEANFAAFKERERFGVTNGNAVLEYKHGMIGE